MEQIRFALNDFLPPLRAKSDSFSIPTPLTHSFYFAFLYTVSTMMKCNYPAPTFSTPNRLAWERSPVQPLIEYILQEKWRTVH